MSSEEATLGRIERRIAAKEEEIRELTSRVAACRARLDYNANLRHTLLTASTARPEGANRLRDEALALFSRSSEAGTAAMEALEERLRLNQESLEEEREVLRELREAYQARRLARAALIASEDALFELQRPSARRERPNRTFRVRRGLPPPPLRVVMRDGDSASPVPSDGGRDSPDRRPPAAASLFEEGDVGLSNPFALYVPAERERARRRILISRNQITPNVSEWQNNLRNATEPYAIYLPEERESAYFRTQGQPPAVIEELESRVRQVERMLARAQ